MFLSFDIVKDEGQEGLILLGTNHFFYLPIRYKLYWNLAVIISRL